MIGSRLHLSKAVVAAIAGSAAVLLSLVPAAAQGAERPVKEILESQIGWKVNVKTGGNVCRPANEECAPVGQKTGEPGGFEYPEGIAVGPGPGHYLYVSDTLNNRVQVLTPTGAFVSMFGWEVDKTTKANVCTAASKDACQAGQPVAGGPAGQIESPTSIAVDQSTGAVYVFDQGNERVDTYTPTGEFVWMAGGEVNETMDKTPGATEAQQNICTEQEIKNSGVKCKSGAESAPGAPKPARFKLEPYGTNLLVAGPNPAPPSERILYVGDEGRVQLLSAAGTYLRELPVAGRVDALAVDAAGDLYLTETIPPQLEASPTIHKFTAAGQEVKDEHWPLTLAPREADAQVRIVTLTLDPAGRLTVTESEKYTKEDKDTTSTYGTLLNGVTGEAITSFSLELRGFIQIAKGLAFSSEAVNGGFPMYATSGEGQQLLSYEPVSVAGLSLSGSPACVAGAEVETNATLDCRVSGSVNPWGVLQTEAWIQWGSTSAVEDQTAARTVCGASCPEAALSFEETVKGLRPNETIYYRLAGRDANVKAPEQLTSQTSVLQVPLVAPRLVGTPEAPFVGASSADLFAELNPENASTEYFVEYSSGEATLAQQCPGGTRAESCPNVLSSTVHELPCQMVSGIEQCTYGTVGANTELTGLQPGTLYRYRLFAESENALKTEKTASIGQGAQEGSFTTALAPAPAALTGAASSLGATSATISGTVDPDGQAATYAFELGLYEADQTRLGIVSTAPAGSGKGFVGESLSLSGLQPGTTYAYRISVKSGYGTMAGATLEFTTEGLPAVIPVPVTLGLLSVPPIAFPSISAQTSVRKAVCRKGYVRGKHGKCVKRKAKRRSKARKPHKQHKH